MFRMHFKCSLEGRYMEGLRDLRFMDRERTVGSPVFWPVTNIEIPSQHSVIHSLFEVPGWKKGRSRRHEIAHAMWDSSTAFVPVLLEKNKQTGKLSKNICLGNIYTFTHIHRHAGTHIYTHAWTRSHTCACTHMHTLTPAHAHAHTYIHTCTRSHTYAHMHSYTHICIHAHTHTCTHMLTNILARACTHTYRLMHAHAHTHTRLHTHTHILFSEWHTSIYSCGESCGFSTCWNWAPKAVIKCVGMMLFCLAVLAHLEICSITYWLVDSNVSVLHTQWLVSETNSMLIVKESLRRSWGNQKTWFNDLKFQEHPTGLRALGQKLVSNICRNVKWPNV